MKRRPKFWWDFNKETTAIKVESNHPKYPILKWFYFDDDATNAIDEAEKMIADLDAGRLTLKRAVRGNNGTEDEDRIP